MPGRKYDLEDRFLEFAVMVSSLTDHFPRSPVAIHITSQLLRCATSPLANYGEAQGAESRKDFVHKLRLCLKELRETHAWLRYVDRLRLCPEKVDAVDGECSELIAIVVSSIKTAAL